MNPSLSNKLLKKLVKNKPILLISYNFINIIKKYIIINTVPKFNLSSMTAGYATFLYTTSDAMFKAISPFFGGFIIYLIFLNIYNTNENPIGIKKAISLLKPVVLIVVITLIAITIFTYILGLPIGPNMKPII